MLLEGLIGVAAASTGVVFGLARRCGATSAERRLVLLHGLVEELHRALEHGRGELDRRLSAIETGLARTETEARMPADHLARSRAGAES